MTIEGLLEAIRTMPVIAIVLFAIGFVFLVFEMFQMGFGVCGGIGIALCIAGIILTADTVLQAVVMIAVMLALIALATWLFICFGIKGKNKDTIVLNSATDSLSGFSSSVGYSYLDGKSGVAETAFRPAGVIVIDGAKYDAVSRGEFIEKGVKLNVLSAVGNRIVVEESSIKIKH